MKHERRCKTFIPSGSKKSKEEDSSSKSSKNSAHFPMSERQQFALLKQMETQASKDDTRSYSPSSAKASPRAQHSNISSNSSTSSSCSIASNKSSLVRVSDDKRIRDLEKKIFKKNYSGETLLIKMAKKGDFNLIKTLIKEGANINEQDFAGWTALHECSIRNYSHIVIYLLKHKANPNLCGGKGDTPLHDAARLGHAKVVKYLLRFGANPKITNENGQSPIDVASNKEIIAIFNKFLNRDPNIKKDTHDDTISENISEDTSVTDFEITDIKTSSNSTKCDPSKPPKKDPYAFDDEELESNEDLKKSLSIGISGSGQPSKVDLSPIGPPLRLRFAKESGFYHLKDQEGSSDKDPSLAKNSPISLETNDESKSAKPDAGLDRTAPIDKQRRISGSTIKEDEDGQRVPPLIIKLGSPEPGHEFDSKTSAPKKEGLSEEDKSDASTPIERNKKRQESERDLPGPEESSSSPFPSTESGNQSSTDPNNPSQLINNNINSTNMSSSSYTGRQQQQISQTSNQRQTSSMINQALSGNLGRRESRSGRTLRSHTAALRERERKDYTKSFYANNGPPKKRRLQNSKSDSQQQSSQPTVHSTNSQDSIIGSRYSEDNNDLMTSNSINGSFNQENVSGDEIGDDLDSSSYQDYDSNAPVSMVQYTQNPYENALLLDKEKTDIISSMSIIDGKLPNEYDQFIMQNKNYLLADKLPTSITKRFVPANINDPVFVELFSQQENERYILELKHLSERENLRISAEQAIIRFYNKSSQRAFGSPNQLTFCNIVDLLESNNVPNIFENLRQSHESVKAYIIKKKQENKPFFTSFQNVIDHFQVEKKKMLSRQLHESDALMMVQKLDWEMKTKELLNISSSFDQMTLFNDIPSNNVPPIAVPEDFSIFPIQKSR